MTQAARQGISAELQARPALDRTAGGKTAKKGCQEVRNASEVPVRQAGICKGVSESKNVNILHVVCCISCCLSALRYGLWVLK